MSPRTYEKDVRIWVKDANKLWKSATITNADEVDIAAEDDEDMMVYNLKVKDEPHLRNPDILECVDDLTELSYLHEPAVLHTLKSRYSQHEIYTYCGIVLVAFNPFQSLDIYSKELTMEYRGKSFGELQPHIFALAENAFSLMSDMEKNSSIVISGESGAGKTVSAKYCMRYFAVVGGSGGESRMEERVLASNPIMEAFGNAKTTRNNNSSRFGKYIAIQFESTHHSITGALMYTYLLEKSRVVFQAQDERSYHIFYQLCAAAFETSDPDMAELEISNCMDYKYINQGNSPTVDRMDDAYEFAETNKALTICGVNDDMRFSIWKLVASILHIGNIEISKSRADEAQVSAEDPALISATTLLGILPADFAKWLSKALIVAGKDTMQKNITSAQALAARDAFAKYIYACLFDWMVVQINKCLESPGHKGRFIGVLDIYGFEVFAVNSFEQFCINYANEKLQQQFNLHVFKLEQDEYTREQIEWTMIDFYDNQPCIDLIEDKLGVLAILDEEARLPKGSNNSFLQKLVGQHKDKDHFDVPRFAQNVFVVKHFTCPVDYTVDGFLEKNKDAVSEQLLCLLEESSSSFIKSLFIRKESAPTPAGSAPVKKSTGKFSTVGSKFKTSLTNLMTTITATSPHYCRCIKPNQTKRAFEFDEESSLEQLRACGVLETVRISAAGYPSRWEYIEFKERYQRLLTKSEIGDKDLKSVCMAIVVKVINDPDKYQFGKTKIFFRAGQVAHLEKLRSNKRRDAVIMIQKIVRGRIGRKRYAKTQNATLICQKMIRGFIARRRVQHLRELRAAICLQASIRSWLARARYTKLRTDVIKVQALARAYFAKKQYMNMRMNDSATRIQSIWRGYRAHTTFKRDVRRIIKIQNLWRAKVARKELKALKMADKDVSKLKEKNWGLENKIMAQQSKLDDMRKELKALKKKVAENAAKELVAQQGKSAEQENQLAEFNAVKQELHEALLVQAEHVAKIAEMAAAMTELTASHETEQNALIGQKLGLEEANVALTARVEEAERGLERTKKRMAKKEKRDANMVVLAGAGAVGASAAVSEIAEENDEAYNLTERADISSTANANAIVETKIISGYKTDPQLNLEIEELRTTVAELQAKNAELQERNLELHDAVEGNPITLLQADGGNSERLRLENAELKEEIASLQAALQRLTSTDQHLPGQRHNSAMVVPKDVDMMDHHSGQFTGSLSRQQSAVAQWDDLAEEEFEHIPASNALADLSEPVGMFMFEESDERALVQELIVGVDPTTLRECRPHGIIAYILFMCLRWADHKNNPRQLQSLLTNSISSIKHVATKNHNKVDLVSFWIANSFVLLNAMKFSEEIQDDPHEYELENFDLAEYRTVLEDLVSQMYLAVIKTVQERLSGMVSSAVLEHNALPNMDSGIHGGRKKSHSGKSKTVADVIAELQDTYDTLLSYGVDFHIISQMFMQLSYFISAQCLNNLLLRKDLCNWSKGLQIQYNVSQIEAWLSEHKLPEAKNKLVSISQATKLLQMQKQSKEDVCIILETCTELNYMQIQKILTMYTPDTADERVPVHVIREIESVGRKRDYRESSRDSNKKPSLMLDLTQIKQALIMHVVPDQSLCDIELPADLNVEFLKKATYGDVIPHE
eukprot:CFRG5427T1